MSITSLLIKNLSNLFGWRTPRKLVIIESDDWGSVRMSSNESYQKLLKLGFPVDKSHYTKYDALESNADLESLYSVLEKHKDKNGNSAVFTAVAIVANPNFQEIQQSGFTKYHFESFTKTLDRYPNHNNVFSLYKEGLQNKLFIPIFHGREHLNVQRWMRALQNNNTSVLYAFKHCVTGIDRGKLNEPLPDFQAAFDLDYPEDVLYMKDILQDGLILFEKLFGYKSKYFVPTNGPFNNSLEVVLKDYGVNYINTAKKQLEPLGNDRYKTNIRFLGQKNKFGQRYITRNCFFEPSSMEHSAGKDWVNDCLRDIEIAFKWSKPAVISSHRVNYIGFLEPYNRERGLKQLDILLSKMMLRWPDIEFITSVELGDLIVNSKSL
jgi:hypothetical protein